MKLHALTTLFLSVVALSSTTPGAQAGRHPHHRHHVAAKQRQAPIFAASPPSGSSSSGPSSSAATSSAAPQPVSSSANPASTPAGSSSNAAQSSSSGSGSVTATTTLPTPVVPVPSGTNGVPPLPFISSGMSTGVPSPVVSTYTAGATPPILGVPPLPTPFVFNVADWPTQDKVPDTTTPDVQKWMKELDGFDIPSWSPTVDGTCAGDPAAAAEASVRGWWSCSRTTRDTDITACPKKMDWGVSFDDGPSPWTQKLLNYLDSQNIKATFFVVGSRVVERPPVLIEEYMAGHEISVHTWSHRPLTSLTNEQIVAELGWTRAIIQTVLGVTPTTMRPPYGDIDDRVRAIALAMGMVPIIWTSTPSSGPFDTNDWRVAGGMVDSITSFNTFESILGNATSLDTGFIVLEHDLYEVTVDLAVGYTLNAALTHNPPFSLKPIGVCSNIPATNMYSESNKNTSFPYTNHTVVTSANSDPDSGPGTSSQNSNSAMDRRISFSWFIAGLIGGGCAMLHSIL